MISTKLSQNLTVLSRLCKTLKSMVASVSEYETASAFENGHDTMVIRRALTEVNHPQPPTPTQVDNATEINFINDPLK